MRSGDPTDPKTPNPDDALAALAATRTDGCPRCLHRGNPPTAGAIYPDRRGVVCRYLCGACGHQWRTAWGAWFITNGLTA